MLKELLFPTLISFFLSYMGTWAIRKIALLHNIVDIPNQRSSHGVPTPRGGGLALVLSFYLVGGYMFLSGKIAITSIVGMGVCGLGIAITGLCDDLFDVAAIRRLISHFFFVGLAVYFLNSDNLFPLSVPTGFYSLFVPCLTVIGIAWLLNLYNFMDGIDGLAGTEAVSVSLGASLILLMVGETANYLPLLIILAASSLGFLCWNWPPAKIFMGDVSSSFLGFCFGIFALVTAASTVMSLWTWLVLLASFIVDATVTLSVRFWSGEKFYEAHRSHAYQILSRKLGSHLKVTMLYCGINWLFLFPLAVLTVFKPDYGAVITIFSYAVLTIFCMVVGAGTVHD